MPSRFLIIQLRRIGDVLLTTPIARILKEARPDATVSFLAEPPGSDLLRGNPYIDEVIVRAPDAGLAESLRLAARLRTARFDVVLDFLAKPRSGLLSLASGAPTRISYALKWRGLYYTHLVRPDDGYSVDYKKSLLRPLGIRSERRRPEIFLTTREQDRARALRAGVVREGDRHLVIVSPASRVATRRWPADYFGELCNLLHRRFGARSLVLWGEGEEAVADAVAAASGGSAIKGPATTLREAAALIACADLHVGVCSAPRHIAVAAGTPSFTILGATSAGWHYPAAEHVDASLGLDCQPCNQVTCPIGLVCLTDLRPASVFAQLETWATSTLPGWEQSS